MARKSTGSGLWSRWRKKTTPRSDQNQEGEAILSKITAEASGRPNPFANSIDVQASDISAPLALPEIGNMSQSMAHDDRPTYRDTIIMERAPVGGYYQSPVSVNPIVNNALVNEKMLQPPPRLHRQLSSLRRESSPAILRSESPGDSHYYPDLTTTTNNNTFEVPSRADSPTSQTSTGSSSLGSESITYVPPQLDDNQPFPPVDPMPAYILKHGLQLGSYSDITLNILGKLYHVHRFILCRAEFFRQMFEDEGAKTAIDDHQGGNVPVVSVFMEDPNVDTKSVDMIFTWLYGGQLQAIDTSSDSVPEEPGSIFITTDTVLLILRAAVILQMKPVIDFCLDFITHYDLAVHHRRPIAHKKFPGIPVEASAGKTRSIETIMNYIEFVENYSFSQRISEAVEDALLSYLCTEGYESLHDIFVKLPLTWLERILEADAFWCPNDFARYEFARSVVLQRRLNSLKRKESEKLQRLSDRVYADIFRYAMIYSNMTYEQLNEVRLDGLVSDQILKKALRHHTQYREFISKLRDEQKIRENDSEPQAFDQNIHLAPMRIGVEFKNVHTLEPEERRYGTTFFCGGSWWSVFLQKFPETESDPFDGNSEEKPLKWGLFLRRAEGQQLTTQASIKNGNKDPMSMFDAPATSNAIQVLNNETLDPVKCHLSGALIDRSVSYYHDPRNVIRASFKLFNPVKKAHEPIFESKMNEYAANQSWGYRSRENVITVLDFQASQILQNTDSPASVRFALILNFEQPSMGESK